jgi:hypothetical protein
MIAVHKWQRQGIGKIVCSVKKFAVVFQFAD